MTRSDARKRDALIRQIRESDIQKAILALLAKHPRIAWAERMNSGVASMGGRRVRFGFKGCPDIIGQTIEGRFVGIEVKRLNGKPSKMQDAFLGRAARNGAIAIVARSIDDVVKALQ